MNDKIEANAVIFELFRFNSLTIPLHKVNYGFPQMSDSLGTVRDLYAILAVRFV